MYFLSISRDFRDGKLKKPLRNKPPGTGREKADL
jgi:hypothetical protein